MKSRALLVLAIIFTGSFVGRIAVMASNIGNTDAASTIKMLHAEEEGICIDGVVAEAVKARAEALDAREAALDDRRAELQAYEDQIEKRLSQLEGVNAKLRATISERQSQRNEDVAKLAAIYEGMKPDQAGKIIEEMDAKFAAGLLAAMNNEQAALIVATLDQKQAYLISVLLANRSEG